MIDPLKVTRTDKFLAATFLKLFPARITPNQITIFRFFTVPFVALLVLSGEHWWAFVLFVSSAFSDALDGALARTTDRVTEWGTIYDPVADKLLIGFAVFLILPQYLNPWIAFAIISLEMLLVGVSYYFRHLKHRQLQVSRWGKSKMIFQSVGVIAVLLYSVFPVALILTLAEIILYVAIALASVSLITYSI